MGLQAPKEAWSLPVPREMSKCLQLAWRGTLLQVPEDFLNSFVIWGIRTMRWRDLGWIPRATTGGFRTEVYGVCCGYLSRSRLNFSLLTAQDSRADEQKP